MGLPAKPQQREPGAAAPVSPAQPKSAVLEVTRSDNGDATYQLLIDGVTQKLNGSVAKWDDASPWESGTYDAAFSKLRGKYDAFLIEYPPNRSDIKFHLGTETGHSEGCIVTRSTNITEIEKVLADNQIPKDSLKFEVKGDFPINFKLSVKDNVKEVARGGTISLMLELTGGGAPGGVSKDIWFHIVADRLDGHEFALVHPEVVPHYISRSSYPDSKKGVMVRLLKGDRSRDYAIRLITPHPHPAQLGQSHAAATKALPIAVSAPAPAVGTQVVFSIDNYKILNKAPGPAPYFYTPSNYKIVLAQSPKTEPVLVTVASSVFHPQAVLPRHPR